MNIQGYDFSEPKRIGVTDSISRAAVYVVMTRENIFSSWTYLYVGQTKDVAERFGQHEKWNCWVKNQKSGGLYVAVLLVPNKDRRLEIETDLINSIVGLLCNRQ